MKFTDLDKSTQVILKVIFAGLVLAFLWVIRDILITLLLALILASAMDPMVEYFNRHKIPRAVSVLTVYILVIGLAGLIFYLITPPVVTQFRVLSSNLPSYIDSLQTRYSGIFGENGLQRFFSETIGAFSSGKNVVSGTYGVFNGFFTFITVLVISFYLVAEKQGMKTFIATLIPEYHRDFTTTLVEKIQGKMGLWLLGQIMLSLSIFILTWIGLSILGVQYALVLALFAGLLEVIPYIGPFVSAIPAVLVALIQNPPLAIFVAILYLIIQKTEGYVLVPKIMQKTVGTSPLVVLLALLIGFKLIGVLGLLIAVPLVGAVTVAVNEFWPAKAV